MPCEAPLIEVEGAAMGEAEEIDAVNRERWVRCVARHYAALRCFDVLEAAGIVAPAGKDQ